MAKKYLDYDGLLYFWQKIKTTFALASHSHTKSEITDFPTEMTPSSHTHGNIQNGGTLQTTDVAVANGDKLVVTDSSNSNKIARTSVAFDGSTENKALTPKGTWKEFNNYVHPTTTAHTAAAVKVGNDASGHVVLGDALTASDVGAVPTTRKVNGKALSADITLGAEDIETSGGDDIETVLDTKVDKVTGKGLSTNDYTTDEKNKLAGIAAGAEVNVNADWNASSGDAQILNKPTIPSAGTGSSYPTMDGTRALGTQAGYARVDHVHPTDTSRAPASHTHGNITNAGALQTTDVDIATGDKLVITDASNSNKVARASIAFTSSSLGSLKALSQEGTWEDVPKVLSTSDSETGRLITFAHLDLDNTSPTYEQVQVSTTLYDQTKINAMFANASSSVATALDGKVDKVTGKGLSTNDYTDAEKTKLGKLVFDANDLIDSSILPSYVDDVIEAYPRSGQTELGSTWLATGSASGTVITPEAGKIYVLMADSTNYSANTQFRWGGTAYVKLADGGVSSITNAEIDTILAS